jgi:hypothetical protein
MFARGSERRQKTKANREQNYCSVSHEFLLSKGLAASFLLTLFIICIMTDFDRKTPNKYKGEPPHVGIMRKTHSTASQHIQPNQARP